MRWGKPLKKDRVRDPRYFLNEDVYDERGLCENEEEISLQEISTDEQTELQLRKALIAAKQLGNEKAVERYTYALKRLKKESTE